MMCIIPILFWVTKIVDSKRTKARPKPITAVDRVKNKLYLTNY